MMFLAMLATIDDPQMQDKFYEIYHKYHGFALRVATYFLKDKTYAEEAVQDAFFYISRNIDDVIVHNEPMLKSYIYRITQSETIRIAKIRQKHMNSADVTIYEEQIESLNPFETTPDKEDDSVAVSAIQSLPDIYRIALTLHFLHSMSARQIAKHLGESLNTVKSRLKRGKLILARKLEKASNTHED